MPEHNRALAIWLLACCVLIFGMVVLGGATRLTGSGLSMVEWDPIFGVIPPLNDAEWQSVFEKYQQSPEYLKINQHKGMDVHGFKSIYWFEFGHRLLGRTIGTAFLLPFLFFLWRGWVQKALIPKLITMFVLGGLQGVLGWYMVKSGLVDNPHVSQYRLTAHLSAAFVIYGFIFWVAMDLLFPRAAASLESVRKMRPFSMSAATLVAITIISGGFVAGLKAGFAYNTFPLMDGHWIPQAIFLLDPIWRNFFENIATVQFDHRLLATLVLTIITIFWFLAQRYELPRRARIGIHALMLMALIQVTLGISTLLLHVPTVLASSHQAGALILFTLMLFVLHSLRPQGKTP